MKCTLQVSEGPQDRNPGVKEKPRNEGESLDIVSTWSCTWVDLAFKEGSSSANGEYSFELGGQSKVVERKCGQKCCGKGRDAVCGMHRDPVKREERVYKLHILWLALAGSV